MFLLIYYILLFILISVCHSILGQIEDATISAQSVRIYRDLSYIIYIPQFFFTGYTFLRGIGFDLKKFNFDEDAKELEITDIDSEEFEVEFGQNLDNYKRTFRRFIREFRYYVLENKFTFTVLSCIFVLVIGTLLYLNFGVYHKTYRQSQNVSHNHLVVNVVDAVLTNLDAGGKVIDGNYYLALSLKIKNNGNSANTLDYENFQIEVAKRKISATLDRASYFPDMGVAYTRATSIAPSYENIYVLTYKIDKELIDEKITLKILDTLTFEIGSVTPIYKTVKLNYETISENKEEKEIEKGKILELSDTFLGMSRVKIEDATLMKSYTYSYQTCTLNYCQDLQNKVSSKSDKQLLVIKRFFDLDTNSTYYIGRKGSSSFVSDFVSLKQNDSTITMSNVTPKEVSDVWVFEVPSSITDISKLKLMIQLRGSYYSMKLN